ncbi:MAG: DNRLRE domain-containing protein [Candidatus Latescibacteria bacterium]|nr:DNRLRE domain-containing protein [Candidatus Latescibacterota bacterium]NIO56301.1 DNRLRE domain-containing protein [Candidatus Latescibacterota bacterium]
MRNSLNVFGQISIAALALVMVFPIAAAGEAITLSPIKDNTLYQQASGNLSNGAGSHIFTGKNASGLVRRALLAFPIADSIPAGATIDSVSLMLFMSRTRSGAQVNELHVVISDWGEGASNATGNEGAGATSMLGDATWIHTFFSTSFWTNPGGDFSPAISASQTVGGIGSYTWTSTQMVTDVQTWLDNPSANFGWIIVGNEASSTTSKRFDSRTNATLSQRPVLFVRYSVSVPVEKETWGGIKAIYR